MGRLLQILGCVLMLAATGLAVGQVARADAAIVAPVVLAYQAAMGGGSESTPTPAPSPAPSATPAPLGTPTPPPIRRGGRLTFNLAGALSLGRTSTTSTFGQTGFFTPTPSPGASSSPGPFPFQNSTANTQNTSELGAGVSASLSRRTASTSTNLLIPVGLSGTGRSAFGEPQLLYSTPKYSFGYGVQELDALGQFQMGSTLRGYGLILPEQKGQLSLFSGPVTGADGEQATVYGALFQETHGRTLYELGGNYANGPDTGSAKTIVFGTASAGRNLSMISEGAWQTRSNGDGDPHGVAMQVRLDDTATKGECSSTLRSVPDQFVTYSAGEIYSDRYADLNCRDSHVPLFFDTNWERTGDGLQGVNIQEIATMGYSPSMRLGGLSLTYTRQDGSSSGQALWTNIGTAALSTQVLHTTVLLGAQLQNSVVQNTHGSSRSFLANINRQIGTRTSFGVSGQVQHQANLTFSTPSPMASGTPGPLLSSLSPNLQKGLAFNVSEQFRKTTVQLSETFTRTISDSSNALQQTPLITLTRRFSPVISVSTSLGFQTLRDSLNPAADGRSRVFSISLTAPFSYGNSNVTGRADPRLPATIVGKVQYASTATGSGATASLSTFTGTGGAGNVLVTLDGKYVERTDLSGGFQFSFIAPGVHQLTIDSSSMPQGFTAAVPVQNITVQGGQTATVNFMIGTYGGVLGHVYGSDSSGSPVPLDGVQLRVDGGAYSKTDNEGAYGFGGLTAGQHEITIIPQSVPATADFPTSALTQKVTVSEGRYSTLDFHAQVLGSIAGTILYAKDMTGQVGDPVLNAYVVAEPGEHAAIDQDDGTFIIDDLPAGDYTVTVDPETLLPGLGAAPVDGITVHLAAGEHYGGMKFEVGQFEKKVVFTLLGGNGPSTNLPPSIRLSEAKLPPRGTAIVTISAPETATDVTATAFGKRITLAYNKTLAKWSGEIEVPEKTTAGSYQVTGTVGGTTPPAAATILVDPKLPLVIVQILTPHPFVGETVIIRARFLVDVREGDKITWQDGEQTVLGKPVSGRVFTFQKTLTLLPLHGALLTPLGPIPIEVL